ncbi:flavin reductase family protein [Salaquimonas pukyongi]|uniref:flavin reductase family protein n=1 Tax=Salaquimonas pukyongi TaxID=2712698 RepID=UPI001967D9E6|nr:flavin reductase family protein [Salaquimonas pukyongi]
MTGFDPRALRDAFGSFMTGVTVVTSRNRDGDPVGFTANSFSSVSLDPPLLLVCPGSFLSSFSVFAECEYFAVNVLAEGQEEISNTFASFKGDRFAKTPHHTGIHDLPLIEGAVACFCCRTFTRVPAGDHAVLIGEVVSFTHQKGDGLGYVGGRYFSLGLERAGASPDLSICGAIIENQGKVLLEKTQAGYCPVQFKADRSAAQRDLLEARLVECGITADIDQVYSSFSGEGAEPAPISWQRRKPRCSRTEWSGSRSVPCRIFNLPPRRSAK